MSVLALVLLAPLLQGEHDLRWGPKVGQVFDMRCRIELRFPDPAKPVDVKTFVQEAKGVLTVRRCTLQEVTFDVVCTKYLLKGLVDNKLVDILFENGVARQQGKEGPESAWLKSECEKPGVLVVTAKGKASMRDHLLKSYFEDSTNVVPLLHGEKVKAGEEFSNALAFPAQGGETWPTVMLKVTPKEATATAAKLTASGRAEFEAGSKVLDLHIKSELEFQVADGYCSKSRFVLNAFDKTKSPDDPTLARGVTTEWELVLRKKE
jgi:hypothetical protein